MHAEHAVMKLMHVQLQSCTMNASDAYTMKFLVVQSQYHVNLDRQTGQLLSTPVKMSAAQNAVCPYGTNARPERGAFTNSAEMS